MLLLFVFISKILIVNEHNTTMLILMRSIKVNTLAIEIYFSA